MQETLRLSEIDKMTHLGDQERKILKMINSKPFRWFLNRVLKEGELIITCDSITMNGKPFSNMLFNKGDMKKLRDNNIISILVKKDRFYVEMANKDDYCVLID